MSDGNESFTDVADATTSHAGIPGFHQQNNTDSPEVTTGNSTLRELIQNCTINNGSLSDSVMEPCYVPLDGTVGITLSSSGVIAIVVAVSVILIALVISVVVILWRRRKREENKTSSWDDNITLSYINPHIDLSKDLDTDLGSLDDDSFLNSLDTMNFVNLWTTRTIKHTKF